MTSFLINIKTILPLFAVFYHCEYSKNNKETDTMPYDTAAIANYFLKKGMMNGKDISPMKLQKLVYFAHGWHLGIYGEPLLNEPVEAWRYGPVIRSIYDEFKHFRNEPITELVETLVQDSDGMFKLAAIDLPENDQTISLLDEVWKVYKKFTAVQLANLTHESGTPWDQTWNQDCKKTWEKRIYIDNDLIEDYFTEKAQQASNASQ